MSRKKHPNKKIESRIGQNPYAILGVAETAAAKEIRKAYLQKVKSSPPEKYPEEFKKIREAYGILKNITKRRELDLSLFRSVSDIEFDSCVPTDLNELFIERIFQLLLVSSNLYIKDFSKFFINIDDEIEALN